MTLFWIPFLYLISLVTSQGIIGGLIDAVDVFGVLEQDNIVDIIDALDVLDIVDHDTIENIVDALDVLNILGSTTTDVLNTTLLAASFGYSSEEHTVITDDGYVIVIYRMFNPNCSSFIERPVLLNHGLIQNSDNWILAGRGSALGLLLADSCFSVWLGNQRGTFYGQKHLTLNPKDDDEFWQYTYDDMGVYDNPAMIDYILKKTGADGINYIGYSQSSGSVVPMCSARPEYCNGGKVKLFMLLAPAGFQGNMTTPLNILASAIQNNQKLFLALPLNKILVRGYFIQDIIKTFCHDLGLIPNAICSAIAELIDMMVVDSVSDTARDLVFKYVPDGASVANFNKYVQAYSDTFKWNDFLDEKKNIAKYGTSSPPEYNFENVKAPTVIIRGLNDHLVDYRDAAMFAQRLPYLLEMIDVADEEWNHFDFCFREDVGQLVYPYVYEYLKQYS